MRTLSAFFVFCSFVLLVSCAQSYTPPEPITDSEDQYSETVEKSFDETWTSLVSYAGESFFAIDDFEKESGLMTLNFGATDVSRFVDCGEGETAAHEGPVVEIYEDSELGSISLDGRMNVFVEEIESEQSRVRVNARYLLTFNKPGNRWNIDFDTGGYGENEGIRCRPTYEAEKSVLRAISK